jgi:hypothetical protein
MMGEEHVPRDGINRQDVYVICALLLQVVFESSHRDDAVAWSASIGSCPSTSCVRCWPDMPVRI